MLSILNPELCQRTLDFPGGIHCTRLPGESMSRLILKLPVSYLLPAKVNGGFKIYVAPVEMSGEATAGLMCAFFDDADCPLTCWRPLTDDEASSALLHALTKREVLVHMFDDQNRELLGYEAEVETPLMAKIRLEHLKYPESSHESLVAAHEQANLWFSLRSEGDDSEAISIKFGEPLFAEDMVISNLRPDLYQFHGGRGYGVTSLERSEPGAYQELDIIVLLQRVFRPNQIYHAPRRHYDKEEIADVLVITDDLCLIVQAKDSPNTEQTLNRTLARKRLVSVSQVKDALKQVSGAVGYLRNTKPLRMIVGEQEVRVDLSNHNVLSLVVVREMFIDTYDEYSRALFDAFEQTGQPCIALDYSELHQYTSYCPEEGKFLGAYFQVFDTARELGEFPRLRFGLNDVHALWREDE